MKILISGLGAMGASLALAIKRVLPSNEIYGYDLPEVVEKALQENIIDQPLNDWPEGASQMDIVFLCTPLKIIEQHLRELSSAVGKETIVTDIGSTKAGLQETVDTCNFRGTYIGGHPMTGTEKSGLSAASHLLYENAIYILTSVDDDIRHKAEESLIPLLNLIKARVMLLDAEIHDQIMAAISHVPHILAVALVNLVGELNGQNKPYLDLAAGSFRDMTRIASSTFNIWKDIIDSNRINIDKILDKLIALLSAYRTRSNDLSEEFSKANHLRNRVPKVGKGFVSPLTDILVYVNDEMGVIAKISNALSDQNIDIRDIELLKIREKEGGVFRMSFDTFSQAEKAVKILKSIRYQASIRE